MSIELLAPAKHLEVGKVAIRCGADAVYIGAPKFGAREAAGNSVEDIAELTQYAHTYWARVYVALNTLLYDHEIADVLKLTERLYQAGIDALIIQDMGLLECDLPPIPLIASTQTHNMTPEKVRFLEQVGFQRVILARELSLEQIRNIRSQTSVKLECFVHGALCVGYSGQCYMSYALGGRSGNRGQCAQPCRKRYSLRDSQGNLLQANRYLLSLKDMDRADYLEELLEAGITSFKIEGRLKDTAYVKNIVGYYRQKLDAALERLHLSRSSSGTTSLEFTPNPQKTFNRGSTPYFLIERDVEIAALDTPKSLGESIGTIKTCETHSITLDTAVEIHNGDGLCFFDQQHTLQGMLVNTVQGTTIYPAVMPDIDPATPVFRNYDHQFQQTLRRQVATRRIGVSIVFQELPDGFCLTAEDEDGNVVSTTIETEKILARSPETAIVNIRKQLVKCGNTEFVCTDVRINWDAPYFLPVAKINALRREVLTMLTETRRRQRPVWRFQLRPNAIPYPEATLSYTGNVLNSKAEAFYRCHGVQSIEPAAEQGQDLRGQQVMTTKYCLRYQFGACCLGNATPWYLTDEDDREFTLRFNCVACEMEIWYDHLSN